MCNCEALSNCVNYGESEPDFTQGFELIGQQPWLRLYRCRACGTRWQLDVDDRSDFAIKVPTGCEWPGFDDRLYRREFFVSFHGGVQQAKCMQMGCDNRALMGMALCVRHAYPEFE